MKFSNNNNTKHSMSRCRQGTG